MLLKVQNKEPITSRCPNCGKGHYVWNRGCSVREALPVEMMLQQQRQWVKTYCDAPPPRNIGVGNPNFTLPCPSTVYSGRILSSPIDTGAASTPAPRSPPGRPRRHQPAPHPGYPPVAYQHSHQKEELHVTLTPTPMKELHRDRDDSVLHSQETTYTRNPVATHRPIGGQRLGHLPHAPALSTTTSTTRHTDDFPRSPSQPTHLSPDSKQPANGPVCGDASDNAQPYLRILQWNIQGISNKYQLRESAIRDRMDVFLLQEMVVPPSRSINMSGCVVHNVSKTIWQSQGIAILVRNTLHSTEVNDPVSCGEGVEVQDIKINLPCGPITLYIYN